MSFLAALLAAADEVADTPLTRGITCGVCVLLGAWLIYVGRINILSETAEESGTRRFVNKTMGKSNTYTGRKARMVGWIRVICGAAVIVFGIVFVFVGPFLADVE